jgi:hypothetical protein
MADVESAAPSLVAPVQLGKRDSTHFHFPLVTHALTGGDALVTYWRLVTFDLPGRGSAALIPVPARNHRQAGGLFEKFQREK